MTCSIGSSIDDHALDSHNRDSKTKDYRAPANYSELRNFFESRNIIDAPQSVSDDLMSIIDTYFEGAQDTNLAVSYLDNDAGTQKKISRTAPNFLSKSRLEKLERQLNGTNSLYNYNFNKADLTINVPKTLYEQEDTLSNSEDVRSINTEYLTKDVAVKIEGPHLQFVITDPKSELTSISTANFPQSISFSNLDSVIELFSLSCKVSTGISSPLNTTQQNADPQNVLSQIKKKEANVTREINSVLSISETSSDYSYRNFNTNNCINRTSSLKSSEFTNNCKLKVRRNSCYDMGISNLPSPIASIRRASCSSTIGASNSVSFKDVDSDDYVYLGWDTLNPKLTRFGAVRRHKTNPKQYYEELEKFRAKKGVPNPKSNFFKRQKVILRYKFKLVFSKKKSTKPEEK